MKHTSAVWDGKSFVDEKMVRCSGRPGSQSSQSPWLYTGILRDISSLKEMQRHILEIASEEQRRIGFELHDGTQQELTGLSLYANALQDTIQAAVELDSPDSPVVQFKPMDFGRLKHTVSLLPSGLLRPSSMCETWRTVYACSNRC